MTYNEILESMRQKFFDISGHNASMMGDIDARLQAVASELYSLSCFEDFSLKQSFVQTATGDYLTKHAQMRGTDRKKATKAKVKLTFSIDEPAAQTISVPMSTICACSNKPYIQFKAATIGLIREGQTEVTISADALGEGEQYNVSEGEIDVIINPPTGIQHVKNTFKASGGSNLESDAALRERLIKSYNVPSSGLTLNSIAEVIEKIDPVKRCKLTLEGNNINVYVQTSDDAISSDLNTKINNSLWALTLLGKTPVIKSAKRKGASLNIEVVCKPRIEDAYAERVKATVNDFISSVEIGGTVDLVKLEYQIMKLDFVSSVIACFENDEAVALAEDEYIAVDNIEVNLL